MFRMAKKILAIDGSGSSSSSSTADQGSSSKKTKHKSKLQDNDTQLGAKPKSTDELGDFSKLKDDPRLPLNVLQIFKITKSWKAIARTMCKTGTAMFLNLFEQNEDLFYLFDRFQHLKRNEIQESMELKEHAATVMSTLDQSISCLNDYDQFINYLHSIGELHRKVPDFKREHFWKIEEPFMKAVKQTLDERCNEKIEEIYRIAIKLIIETIADGYGQDQSSPGTQDITNKPSSSGSGSGSDARYGDGKHQIPPANRSQADSSPNQTATKSPVPRSSGYNGRQQGCASMKDNYNTNLLASTLGQLSSVICMTETQEINKNHNPNMQGEHDQCDLSKTIFGIMNNINQCIGAPKIQNDFKPLQCPIIMNHIT